MRDARDVLCGRRFPAAGAGSAGRRKKRTYVMSVTPMKRATAQRSRLMM
jgi:hypothetical protein